MDITLRNKFLNNLKGKTNKYKRYPGSTLRYGGGKSLAVGSIIEYIPENIDLIVSPFLGGASVEIALSKELGIKVISYDIFDLLVNFWNFQVKFPDQLYEKLSELLHKHKGGFILSYNDCSFVREHYSDFKIVDIQWQYTMGQGETRIGKNRLEINYDNNNVKTSHELLIIGDRKGL